MACAAAAALACIRELERSGRWKCYYTNEQYASYLRGAERAVALWRGLAPGTNDAHPAA